MGEAFKWSEVRQVTKIAIVRLFANSYCVDPSLVGRKVELALDPFDLTTLELRFRGQPMGMAIPQIIGRHAHPKAKAEQPATAAPEPGTGIHYLRLLDDQQTATLATQINYTALNSKNTDRQGEDEQPASTHGAVLAGEEQS
nr:Mu transposase C-terminal domain-containing protein [Nonomuraea jiangxiensis]